MRALNEHKVNPANDILTVVAIDEPGYGGANQAYDISGGQAIPTFNGPIAADGDGFQREADAKDRYTVLAYNVLRERVKRYALLLENACLMLTPPLVLVSVGKMTFWIFSICPTVSSFA